MYIHRIILRDVKSIEHLDITLHDDWRDEPLKSILLTGPNGSGKTTILRVIVAIWIYLKHTLLYNNYFIMENISDEESRLIEVLSGAKFAAIELHNFASEPVWIFYASDSKYFKELENTLPPDTKFLSGGGLGAADFNRTKVGSENFYQWRQNLATQLERLFKIGEASTSLPNILYIEATSPFVGNREQRGAQSVERFYEWLVLYPLLLKNFGHIEELLRNLKIRSEENFNRAIVAINGFLGNKKHLTDFDESLRLRVQLNDGSNKFHYIEDLSSGEQQCILMMYLASRWLMPGGIMLVDEPDLHLHESLQRHFLRELEKVVLEKQGQLIITSHSPTVWKEYSEAQSIDLGEKMHG